MEGSYMYNLILSNLKNEYYQNHYPNDGQRFVAWYLRNIHGLDTIQAKACITDGANDKQIDAIYIDNQENKIYIIQGKFYSGEVIDASPLRDVLSSWAQIQDLAHLQEGANDKLKVKIEEVSKAINDDDYEIVFELITTSALTNSALKDLERFQEEIASNEKIDASLDLVDNDKLKAKYDESINKVKPYINHIFNLERDKYMEVKIGDTKAIIAAIPLKECLSIPGINDGTLFRKNVRQSLGSSNKVNKGIALTIKENSEDFFFLHNGVTAICSSMKIENERLVVNDLSVVNGCQSLNTIYKTSEIVKKSDRAYILFRFYEINNPLKADKISTCTNSQSAVKPRDLRSNDKNVLKLKKQYEEKYPQGYFITKRGENVNQVKCDKKYIVNLTDLGKQLIAWHSQRPNLSYGETKIFDKYFDQLFRREYAPECVQALNEMWNYIYSRWNDNNEFKLNENLLAMKAYAPYHQLYAISIIACEINQMNDSVPNPYDVYKKMQDNQIVDVIMSFAATVLNSAFDAANTDASDNDKLFVPQNWIKSKTSLKDIRSAVKTFLASLKFAPSMNEVLEKIINGLSMKKENFEARWTAD